MFDSEGMIAPARRATKVVAVSVLTLVVILSASLEAYAQVCKPRRPRPPVVLTTMGPCEFNPETASFAGDPVEQAMCLMRSADRTRNLGPRLESLPRGIATRVGETTGLPDREALSEFLVEQGLVWDFAPFLWTPLGRARDNDPMAPQSRYLVIHDTSAPFIGGRPFPDDIDENRSINSLARYRCRDDWAFAHVFINRMGDMLLSRELSEPWRATKFERGTRFGADLKGLFLHVELVQPRGSFGRGRNDARAPDPGFSEAQYDRLALIYVIASVRAQRWLIPAFHVAIDSGVRGGHDDPQNFDVDAFSWSIDRLVRRLQYRQRMSELAPEPDPAPTEPIAVPTAVSQGRAPATTPTAVSQGRAPVARVSPVDLASDATP